MLAAVLQRRAAAITFEHFDEVRGIEKSQLKQRRKTLFLKNYGISVKNKYIFEISDLTL